MHGTQPSGDLLAPEQVKNALRLMETNSTWHSTPFSAALMTDWIERGVIGKTWEAVRAEVTRRQYWQTRLSAHLSSRHTLNQSSNG